MNVVFDLGAVLLTWEPVALVQANFEPHAPTAEAAHTLAGQMFHHEDWLGFDRGTHSLDDAIGRMALRLALPADRLSDVLAPMGERLEPIAVTVDLLASLRARRDAGEDLRLYYLSNMPAPYARVLEYRHAFFRWFDGGIFSGDVRVIKPQPEIYGLLAERYRLKGAETVFIDDSLANVVAAREFGWHAIHCERPSAVPAQLAAYLPVNSTLSTSKPSVRA
ncbi:HAD family phosphatase [Variovorax sp. J22P240]|uniref:HAD family hydrolase n=1 Tax=unclassified Variovorax TaxID=663243 RepID=UPI002574F960|nr:MULTISPECIES: HAD family phosphatase [unclassified Variovorax]MDM0000874.1 HAD family phosphatase [Variovorax sp. J22P240]MDM0050064.1 HAD family phosphatase [Variovorax sp. J22R115]